MKTLQLRSVSKTFGEVAAVDDVSLEVPAGALPCGPCAAAVVGPDGALAVVLALPLGADPGVS